ncbi:MAG: hypothetical protein K8L99_14495, partial [Anaerolineae bacterium]|nr:hypothetical protein [Anaerolineae bacterium]
MVTITREGLVDRNRQVHDLSDEVLSVNLEPSDPHHSTPNQRFDLDQSHQMTPLPSARPEHRFRVGVIVPAVITDDYIGAVVRGISKAVKAQGGTMVLNTQSAEHRDSLSALMLGPRRCDGVILVVPLNMQRVL